MPKRVESTGFAAQLKRLREQAGLNQDELAERAALYKFSVAKLEQGVREPTWATVLALAAALGVGVEAFALPPAEEAPPRPRGRPKKAEVEEALVPEPPRPRGRPRKAADTPAAKPAGKKGQRKRKEK